MTIKFFGEYEIDFKRMSENKIHSLKCGLIRTKAGARPQMQNTAAFLIKIITLIPCHLFFALQSNVYLFCFEVFHF